MQYIIARFAPYGPMLFYCQGYWTLGIDIATRLTFDEATTIRDGLLPRFPTVTILSA